MQLKRSQARRWRQVCNDHTECRSCHGIQPQTDVEEPERYVARYDGTVFRVPIIAKGSILRRQLEKPVTVRAAWRYLPQRRNRCPSPGNSKACRRVTMVLLKSKRSIVLKRRHRSRRACDASIKEFCSFLFRVRAIGRGYRFFEKLISHDHTTKDIFQESMKSTRKRLLQQG